MDDVRIIEVTEDDAGVLERVAPGVFDRLLVPEQTRAFLADPRHVLVVAVVGGQVVGMVSSVEYYHPDKPPALWVNEVGVAEPFHRRGIGRRMMRRVLEIARDRGCANAWVGTDVGNVAARALFESCGAVVESDRYVEYEWSLAPRSK